MTLGFALSVIAVTTGLYLLARLVWWGLGWIVAIKVSRGIAAFSIELAALRLHRKLCEQTHHLKKEEPGANQALKAPSIN